MKSITIQLKAINDVKEFVGVTAGLTCDVDLVSGRYVIDGKSIMGIFSLDLSKPIEVQVNGDCEEECIAKLEKFKA